MGIPIAVHSFTGSSHYPYDCNYYYNNHNKDAACSQLSDYYKKPKIHLKRGSKLLLNAAAKTKTNALSIFNDDNKDAISIYLLDVNKIPFTPPKVDNATNTGIMKAKLPYIFPAND